ncbi:hypothetical protein [Anaeromyxobacter diazotrophicus]|nr:hypothetical protein [Anaeromyxobacter diazotrophicus]
MSAASKQPAPANKQASGALTTHHTTDATGAITLRDETGAAILAGSTVPYSPEKTCGGCHDVDVITRGYHFQQGRTDATNQIVVSDSFNPTKPWLLSKGMYGKT